MTNPEGRTHRNWDVKLELHLRKQSRGAYFTAAESGKGKDVASFQESKFRLSHFQECNGKGPEDESLPSSEQDESSGKKQNPPAKIRSFDIFTALDWGEGDYGE